MKVTSSDTKKFVDRSYRIRPMVYMPSASFFDGVAQLGDCKCNVMLSIDWVTEYHLWWHGGSGSNTKVEAMALWRFL